MTNEARCLDHADQTAETGKNILIAQFGRQRSVCLNAVLKRNDHGVLCDQWAHGLLGQNNLWETTPAHVLLERRVSEDLVHDRAVIGGIGEIAERAIGHEGVAGLALGEDLTPEDLELIAVDGLDVGTQPVEPDLELGPEFPGPYDAGVVLGGRSTTVTLPLTNTGGSPLEVRVLEAYQGGSWSVTDIATGDIDTLIGIETLHFDDVDMIA